MGHATLTSISGIIDEFMIFVSAITFGYTVIYIFRTKPIPKSIYFVLLLVTILYGATLIFFPFAGAIMTVISQIILNLIAFIFIFVKKINKGKFEELGLMNTIYFALIIEFIALSLAIADIVACPYFDYSVLHAIWHLGVGTAIHLFLSLLFQIRYSVIDDNNKEMRLVSMTGIRMLPFYINVSNYRAIATAISSAEETGTDIQCVTEDEVDA